MIFNDIMYLRKKKIMLLKTLTLTEVHSSNSYIHLVTNFVIFQRNNRVVMQNNHAQGKFIFWQS